VNPIRANPFPPATATPPAGADAARIAAQKTFFAAAMGQAAAPAAAQPARAAIGPPAVQRAEIRPDPSTDLPAKLLRPGSLLDIRV
jgi:hypothetical protein